MKTQKFPKHTNELNLLAHTIHKHTYLSLQMHLDCVIWKLKSIKIKQNRLHVSKLKLVRVTRGRTPIRLTFHIEKLWNSYQKNLGSGANWIGYCTSSSIAHSHSNKKTDKKNSNYKLAERIQQQKKLYERTHFRLSMIIANHRLVGWLTCDIRGWISRFEIHWKPHCKHEVDRHPWFVDHYSDGNNCKLAKTYAISTSQTFLLVFSSLSHDKIYTFFFITHSLKHTQTHWFHIIFYHIILAFLVLHQKKFALTHLA